MNNLDVDATVVKNCRFVNRRVRVLKQHDQSWFSLTDTCHILGYSSIKDVVSKLNQNDLMKLNYREAQNRIPILIHEIWGKPCNLTQYFVDEKGLSTMIVYSHVPKDNIYKNWLVNNLMPSMIPTLKKRINQAFKKHKIMLMTSGWRMIQNRKLSVF